MVWCDRPPSWLICDGAVIERATYSELFDVISTTYGGGNGSTTFAIPDLKGRTTIGVGESSATGHTAHTLGSSSGEETHVLSVEELAQHRHLNYVFDGYKSYASGSIWGCGYNDSATNWKNSFYTGSNWAHNTMQPFVTMNYIIYTGVE